MDKGKVETRIMIDGSHANSGKKHENQPGVTEAIAEQVAAGSQSIGGVMLESFLVEGRQSQVAGQELTYGQSITDACMGWEASETALKVLAKAVQARRAL